MPDVSVAPGDGMPVVGTGRGLAELERRVVLSALAAASGATERDETSH